MNYLNKLAALAAILIAPTICSAQDAEPDFSDYTPVALSAEPASGSILERLGSVDLSFVDAVLPSMESLSVVQTVNFRPTVMFRPKGETEWIESSPAQVRINEIGCLATINIRPALTAEGQYRITLPYGTISSVTTYPDDVVFKYVSEETVLNYAIGEDVGDGVSKAMVFVSSNPPEGAVNLTTMPSGVEYLQYVFNPAPEIDRSLDASIILYHGDEQIESVAASNTERLFVQTQGVQNEYSNILHVYFRGDASDIDMPGDYTVVIPAGLLTFNGEPCKEMKFNYHIDKTLSFQLFPFNGVTANTLEDIILDFNQASEVRVNPDCSEPLAMGTKSLDFEPQVKIDGKIVRIHTEGADKYGHYMLRIPNGFFKAVVDGEELDNQLLEFEYNIAELAAPACEPAQGVLSGDSFFRVTLDLGEDAEITATNQSPLNRLLQVNDNGEIVYVPVVSNYVLEDPSIAVGDYMVSLIPQGQSKLTLPAGNYVLITTRYIYTVTGGYMAGEYFYYWTVLPKDAETLEAKLTPNDNVQDSNIFTIDFADDVRVKRVANRQPSWLCKVNEDGSEGDVVATFTAAKGARPNQVDLINDDSELKAIPAGVYRMKTVKGLVTDEADRVSDAYGFMVYYGMSGISAIDADAAADAAVYSIDGLRIADSATPAVIESLPRGLYIINGKKIVK